MSTPMVVGLLCGREFSFPPAFIHAVNELGRPHGITAEMVKLGKARPEHMLHTAPSCGPGEG